MYNYKILDGPLGRETITDVPGASNLDAPYRALESLGASGPDFPAARDAIFGGYALGHNPANLGLHVVKAKETLMALE